MADELARVVDFFSIGLMLLEASRGTSLTIQAEGEDEVAAVDALVRLVEQDFAEATS